MKLGDLVKKFAEERNISQKEAKAIMEDFFKVVHNALLDGEKVPLGVLGYLSVKQKPARNGVNPSTGEKIVIPARKVVVYKASKELKENVNK